MTKIWLSFESDITLFHILDYLLVNFTSENILTHEKLLTCVQNVCIFLLGNCCSKR